MIIYSDAKVLAPNAPLLCLVETLTNKATLAVIQVVFFNHLQSASSCCELLQFEVLHLYKRWNKMGILYEQVIQQNDWQQVHDREVLSS